MKHVAVTLCAAYLLSGCAGYHLGSVKPHYLHDINTIAVAMFTNRTYTPRMESLVTTTVVKEFQRDGTYRIVNGDQADAVLHGEISALSRVPARSVRGNVLQTQEFVLRLTINYNLTTRDGKPIGVQGSVAGTSSFFVSADVQTDERQALPLATEEAAKSLVANLSEGW